MCRSLGWKKMFCSVTERRYKVLFGLVSVFFLSGRSTDSECQFGGLECLWGLLGQVTRESIDTCRFCLFVFHLVSVHWTSSGLSSVFQAVSVLCFQKKIKEGMKRRNKKGQIVFVRRWFKKIWITVCDCKKFTQQNILKRWQICDKITTAVHKSDVAVLYCFKLRARDRCFILFYTVI